SIFQSYEFRRAHAQKRISGSKNDRSGQAVRGWEFPSHQRCEAVERDQFTGRIRRINESIKCPVSPQRAIGIKPRIGHAPEPFPWSHFKSTGHLSMAADRNGQWVFGPASGATPSEKF